MKLIVKNKMHTLIQGQPITAYESNAVCLFQYLHSFYTTIDVINLHKKNLKNILCLITHRLGVGIISRKIIAIPKEYNI